MLLMSHNLFHRGARRLDTPEEQKELPRFMFRFMLFRTTDPEPPDMTEAPTMTAEESHEAWTQTTDHMTGPLLLFLLPSLSWGSCLRFEQFPHEETCSNSVWKALKRTGSALSSPES